ncbi:NAD-dependent epimerase/dehydratase family protein [Oleiharenicola lentus]|uniref:NAD-dependent epimerase/dehydratase family protein n=1 Tax=Oleiharenicola lentus TaxID=2508720 RepID=UPI003F663EC9
MSLRVAITGASGFLGHALLQRLLNAGLEVHALSRNPSSMEGVRWHAYNLAEPVPQVIESCDVIVHAAFAMGANANSLEAVNKDAAAHLLAVARTYRRHFIFISSMSAHDHAESSYGRTKWAIEQTLDPTQDTIVRPGLIVGAGGVYQRMLESLRSTPIVPIFFGGMQPIHPVALEDLVEGLFHIISRRIPGIFNLGSIEPISVRELYRRMLHSAGLRRTIIPLPGSLALRGLRATEALGLRLPLTTENLLGQKHLRSFETANSYTRLGISPAPLTNFSWSPTFTHRL